MKGRFASFAAIVGLVSLAAACERDPFSAFAAHSAGHGTARLYDEPFDEVWEATHVALHREPGRVLEDHLADSPDEPFVITKPGVLDQVGVWFLPEGSGNTIVNVVVMTGIESTSGIVGADESSVQRDIAKALVRIEREGKREQTPRARW